MRKLIQFVFLLCPCPTVVAAQESPALVQPPAQLAGPESDATRVAAANALGALGAANELANAGKRGEVRDLLRATIAELLAVPGREASEAITDVLEQLGQASADSSDTEFAVQALEPVLAFRLARNGPDDGRVQLLRATIGRSCWELGRLETSKQLLGQVFDHAKRTFERDDRRLCTAMSDYAVTLYYLDDCLNARNLMSEVVEA